MEARTRSLDRQRDLRFCVQPVTRGPASHKTTLGIVWISEPPSDLFCVIRTWERSGSGGREADRDADYIHNSENQFHAACSFQILARSPGVTKMLPGITTHNFSEVHHGRMV